MLETLEERVTPDATVLVTVNPTLTLANNFGAPLAGGNLIPLGLDASNYSVLYDGGVGHQLHLNNLTVNGNIGVSGTGSVHISGPGSIGGQLNFSASDTGQFKNDGPNLGPDSIAFNSSSVTNAANTVNALNSSLAGLGAPISISGNMTINESSGELVTVNGTTYRVFNVVSYSEHDGNTVTIQGDGSGIPVVFNFSSNQDVNLGGDVVLANGLTSDQLLWNVTSSGQNVTLSNNASKYPGLAFQGTILAPNDSIDVNNASLIGRIFGGGSADMHIGPGDIINAPSPLNPLPLAITIDVTSASGAAVDSGTISLSLVNGKSTINLGAAVVNANGTAILDVTNPATLQALAALAPGAYSLIETYAPVAGSAFTSSTTTGSLTISGFPTTLVVGVPSITLGSTTSFTITVGATSLTGAAPFGTVTIDLVNGKQIIPLGTATLGADGTATLTVTGTALVELESLPPGSYQLVETFNAAANSPFASTTTTTTLTINGTPVTLVVPSPVISVSVIPSGVTIPVVVTTSSGAVPSGKVKIDLIFGNTTITVGTVTLGPSGMATLRVTGAPLAALEALPPGTYELIETFTGSTGTPFVTTTGAGTITINATTTPSTGVVPGNAIVGEGGGAVNVPVAVNSAGGTVNTGTVTVTLVTGTTSSVVGSVSVSNGTANVQATIPAGLAPGSYTLVETFTDASGHFLGSSNNGVLTVTAPEPLPPGVAALELAIYLAAIPNLGNAGAMQELQLFSEVLLHQPVPTLIPALIAGIQSVTPQTGSLQIPALAFGMWLANDLAIENPQS